ncbi:Phosphoribosylaminoimidazole-succinocarboxamide synthase [uncultured delta proteobacterium]|uniref:phosphoribosylaminoimidazolesuccinocarboxamide synthase n=1 Tax=uncultured delta proteobacterium TaxID=34034 RepID=A0A212J2Z7_9DELT|nr:Phosphoribosylaminoimidazole-succinocarboxamide synthase [uncultured delta proteobacterium]
MQLVYRGKTKDVYEKGPGVFHLVFTDRVTKNDAGEIDPGGNNLAEETIPGQGEACLLMTSAIFKEINEKNIARTHMLSFDLPSLSMDVVKAKMFTPGIEWVARWVCTGSFLRRYAMVPGVKDGMRLPSPVFEVTLKDDAAGDPPIVPSALVALGIVDGKVMDELWEKNRAVMAAIKDMFTARKLDLWDIKIEWGLDENGAPLLIDEVSPGCCRAFKAGTTERVLGQELAEYFRR